MQQKETAHENALSYLLVAILLGMVRYPAARAAWSDLLLVYIVLVQQRNESKERRKRCCLLVELKNP
jgi:hypothetical protein